MSTAGAWALSGVGLASASVGAFIGFAFGIPALGLSQYGRNPVGVTAVGEGFASVLYFFGAILQIRGGRVLAQPRRPTRKGLLLSLVAIGYGSVLVVVLAARNGVWEAIPLALIFTVFVVAPIWAGMLSVWMGSAPESGDGASVSRRRAKCPRHWTGRPGPRAACSAHPTLGTDACPCSGAELR